MPYSHRFHCVNMSRCKYLVSSIKYYKNFGHEVIFTFLLVSK
uniref:Uncharacterized protein n=1 Tax=Arundo donax TaxID=35708 RepID=A0A0A9EAN7_ARUDO